MRIPIIRFLFSSSAPWDHQFNWMSWPPEVAGAPAAAAGFGAAVAAPAAAGAAPLAGAAPELAGAAPELAGAAGAALPHAAINDPAAASPVRPATVFSRRRRDTATAGRARSVMLPSPAVIDNPLPIGACCAPRHPAPASAVCRADACADRCAGCRRLPRHRAWRAWAALDTWSRARCPPRYDLPGSRAPLRLADGAVRHIVKGVSRVVAT